MLKTTRKISGSALWQLPQKCYINNVAIIIIAFQKEIFNASTKLKTNFEITSVPEGEDTYRRAGGFWVRALYKSRPKREEEGSGLKGYCLRKDNNKLMKI